MRRSTLPLVVALASLFGLLMAAPASAATTGTICGQVTAFTAPTAVDNGSLTIDGTVEVIDTAAFGSLAAGTLTALSAVALADATTCLNITANEASEIIDIDIAAQAEICGAVTLNTTLGLYSVAGVTIPAGLVGADADLEALLDAAARAGATACLDVTIDSTTGLFTSVSLSATINVCGDATLDADSVVLGGVDVPLTLLDAEARAALAVALDAGADVCLQLVVDGTDLVQANLSVDVDLCGDVTLDAEGDVVVDGVEIPDSLLTASAAALLELAASADGTACASVVASTTGGNTSVGVTVTIEVCAAVTAVTDDTVTIGDVTFVLAGAAESGIEIGDVLCVAAGTGPTGEPVITDPDTTDGSGTPGPGTGAGGAGGGPLLPDTAATAPAERNVGGMVLLAIGAMALIAAIARRSEVSLR